MRRAHWCVPESLIKANMVFILVAIAVGRDVFRPDARTLVDTLINIQSATLPVLTLSLTHITVARFARRPV